MHDFLCECGRRTEELFFQGEEIPASLVCKCGKNAPRKRLYRFRIVGPVSEHLEVYEQALFTDRQRAAGARIRSAKDIERVEREQGIHREDATFYREARDEQRHEEWQIKKVQREDGVEAALDFVDDMRTKEATGWDQKELNVYKEHVHAAEQTGPRPDADIIANGLTEPTGLG